MSKMKYTLLVATAWLLGLGAHAQLSDVTSTYIASPGFEDCEALPADNGMVSVIFHWNTYAGTDYADQGWKLVEQRQNGNGGVIEYGNKVKYSSYANDENPVVAREGSVGTKALCFSGAKSVTYVQTDEVTLPAGSYRFTVNVRAAHLTTSSMPETTKLWNTTGFVADDGTEYLSTKTDFLTNRWDTDVIEILLPRETKGRFQINYGNSYYIVIDDLKLEYEQKVITADLEQVIVKAEALSAAMNGQSESLTDAIAAARSFVNAPTTQDDVPVKVEELYAAMATALESVAAGTLVDLTAAYLDNPSFEAGVYEPWAGTGYVTQPVEPSNIDGANMGSFEYGVKTFAINQTVGHLPAGCYLASALQREKSSIVLGSTENAWTGGSGTLFLRGHSKVVNNAATGELVVGAKGTVSFAADDFRFFYAKDEATLLAKALADVKADAEVLLNDANYAAVTGAERQAIADAMNQDVADVTEQVKAIHSAMLAFVAAKDDYNKFAKEKTNAAAYTHEAYPYGSRDLLAQIELIIATDASSAANAKELTSELKAACFDFYVSNAYCEGIDNATDYTDKIAAANATGTTVNAAWHKLNMDIRTDKTAWVNPKSGEEDKNVYGVTADYYRTAKDKNAYMWQTVSGLPAGTYVLAVTYMSTAAMKPELQIDGQSVDTFTGVGTYGGGQYGGGWIENVFEFEKATDADMELRLTSTGTANYQEWFFDNLRLFCIAVNGIDVGISEVNAEAAADRYAVYSLQGTRVSQPAKGLFIVNGKKVVLK